MSEKHAMIVVNPPSYGGNERTTVGGFECPKCHGRGQLREWGAMRHEPQFYDCDRCQGSGRLSAVVSIDWQPEPREQSAE